MEARSVRNGLNGPPLSSPLEGGCGPLGTVIRHLGAEVQVAGERVLVPFSSCRTSRARPPTIRKPRFEEAGQDVVDVRECPATGVVKEPVGVPVLAPLTGPAFVGGARLEGRVERSC